MKVKLGNYYYHRRRTKYSVNVLTEIIRKVTGELMSMREEPVELCIYESEARKKVYSHNGWDGTPVKRNKIVAVLRYTHEMWGQVEKIIYTFCDTIEDAKRYISHLPLAGNPEQYSYETYEG